MKRNWKVLNIITGKIKGSLHNEFIVDSVSTNDTTINCDAFGNIFNDHPRYIHISIPISNSHNLDTLEIIDRSRCIRYAKETNIVEFITHLKKADVNNDVSRKFLVICKSYFSFHLKELSGFFITSDVDPNVSKLTQITPIHN